jgi:glycosyltransferase involved in cell wall biosynthesis
LRSYGWHIDVIPFFSDEYIEKLYLNKSRIIEIIIAYFKRLLALIESKKYDLLWIEKELFPFLPATAERVFRILRIRYLVDYDDALFHRYDLNKSLLVKVFLSRKIDKVMRNSDLVIAGNDYLAERAKKAGAERIEVIPTVIDLNRYPTIEKINNKNKKQLIVGWIGTPKTSHYLHSLREVFKSLKSEYEVRFIGVGASRQSLGDLPVEPQEWSEFTEVELIRQFDIGIMPLSDSPWERGKCGYKLIQYMACGLPVVASPVGVNKVIIDQNVNGLLANDNEQWKKALSFLLSNSTKRKEMGMNGRRKVEEWYSIQVQAPRIKNLISNLIEEK